MPENAFVVCTFWYVNALAALGRRDEARALFERLLACRNAHGLLAEHVDPRTGEHWGNFVQTYSMVGLISAAIRLSVPLGRRRSERAGEVTAPARRFSRRPQPAARLVIAATSARRLLRAGHGRTVRRR